MSKSASLSKKDRKERDTIASLSRAFDAFEAKERQTPPPNPPLSPYLAAQPILSFLLSIHPQLTTLLHSSPTPSPSSPSPFPSPSPPTSELLERFSSWLLQHAPDCGLSRTFAFRAGSGGRGNSVVALLPLPPSARLMCIPHRVVVTAAGFHPQSTSAYASPPAGAFASFLTSLHDPLLSNLPSLTLSLLLLYERQRGAASPLAPYLDILPRAFTLPLFLPPSSLHLLQRSPALLTVVNTQYNVLKQYLYLHQLLTTERVLPSPAHPAPHARHAPFLSPFSPPHTPFSFTLPAYLWSIAVVMSRQNRLPSPSSTSFYDLALIPGWDLCNHRASVGCINTSFDPVSGDSEMVVDVVRGVEAGGEEVCLFYGSRGVREMWVYSGFVEEEGNEAREYEMVVEEDEGEGVVGEGQGGQGGGGGRGKGGRRVKEGWEKIRDVMRKKAGVDAAHTLTLPLPYSDAEWASHVHTRRQQDAQRAAQAADAWARYTAAGGTMAQPDPIPEPPPTVPTVVEEDGNRGRYASLMSWCRIAGVRRKEEAEEALRVQAMGREVGRLGVEVERRGLGVLLRALEREEMGYEGGLEGAQVEVREWEEKVRRGGMDEERQLLMVKMRVDGMRMLQSAQQRVRQWMAALDTEQQEG